jgi:hypothetical protein
MKTKLTLVVLLFLALASESFAFKIIITGGGSSNKYHYVYVDDNTLKCTGRGSNCCPISFCTSQARSTGNWFNSEDVVNYVFNKVSEGYTSGEGVYNDELPVSWKQDDDGNLEIDIDEMGSRVPKDINHLPCENGN